jgi:hypothetical protein
MLLRNRLKRTQRCVDGSISIERQPGRRRPGLTTRSTDCRHLSGCEVCLDDEHEEWREGITAGRREGPGKGDMILRYRGEV